MNIKFSQFHNRNKIELKISPLLSFTNKKNPKELKSVEKEQKFFKEVFPRIFSDKKEKSKKPEEHSVPGLDKKVKGISLSEQTYNKYMGNYKNLLKYPSNNFYSTERLRNFVPYAMLKDINLNKKKNFYLTLNDFRTSQYNVYNNTNDNNSSSVNFTGPGFRNNKILNQKKIICVTNYGNKDIWKVNEKENYQMNDNEVFKYFIEGTFLIEPEKLQYININEQKIHPHLLDKNEFDFYSTYLDNLHKNENFTDNKIKEYEMCLFKGYNKSKFVLEIKSICFSFEEIDFNNNKNINNSSDSKDKDNVKKNMQKIYLPFKYLPLFFLLSYKSLKVFISEIISYEVENNKFIIIVNDKLEKIVKKYSEYCQNKINLYTYENNEQVFNDIIYYQNELHFNYIFPWIVYDNRYTDIKSKYYQLKIHLPTLIFQANDSGIRFQKFVNKWIIFELIKNNFQFWDRYLLYNLFMIKKFRKTISYIINKKRNHISYEYTTKTVGDIIDSNIDKKNNFDFFVSDVLSGENHYYYFTPFKAMIFSRNHNKYDLNDSISPQLVDSRKIYILAKHFGLNGTFNKCMYYNKLTKKYNFTSKFLKDITQDYILSLKEDHCILNKKQKQVFKYNGTEYHLIIRECLLCEKVINIYNYSEYKYYKIPHNFFSTILEKESDDNYSDIISILLRESNNFINMEEIEEYKEYFMKNYLCDSSSSKSKASKDRNKRKNKNSSNISIKKVETKKNSENLNPENIIQLKTTNYIVKHMNSNKSIRNNLALTSQILRRSSDVNKKNINRISIKNKSITKKNTINEHIKNDSGIKIFDLNENNNININNNNKSNNNKNNLFNINIEKKSKFVSNIENKNQLELMRIKREVKKTNSINDIERLKIDLKNNNNNFMSNNYMKLK